MNLIMIIMICVGCAAGLAGLIYLVVRAVALVRAAKRAEVAALAQVQALVRGGQLLGPRLQELRRKQEAMAAQLQRMSAAMKDLLLLRDEITKITKLVTRIKS